MKLYKYCDKHGLDILKYKALKLSRIDDYNDPFEFKIGKSSDPRNNEIFEDLYKFQKESYRILCFTARENSVVMWGHYSKNHSGILIKFDTDKIILNNQKLCGVIEPVDYQTEMIKIPDNFFSLEVEKQSDIIRKNTFKKYIDWKYEEEHRVIIGYDKSESKRYIGINSEAVLEVIIGFRSDLATELSVKEILKRHEYQHVKLKRAIPHDSEYGMKYVDVK
jgi:hypothetical protein